MAGLFLVFEHGCPLRSPLRTFGTGALVQLIIVINQSVFGPAALRAPAAVLHPVQGGSVRAGLFDPPSTLVVLRLSHIPASMISNRQIVDGVKDALFRAFKAWLDENRADILKMTAEAGAATARGQKKPGFEPEPVPHRPFLTTAQLAERWHCHPESVRRLVRTGALISVRLGRQVRLPLKEVERYEQQATLEGRR